MLLLPIPQDGVRFCKKKITTSLRIFLMGWGGHFLSSLGTKNAWTSLTSTRTMLEMNMSVLDVLPWEYSRSDGLEKLEEWSIVEHVCSSTRPRVFSESPPCCRGDYLFNALGTHYSQVNCIPSQKNKISCHEIPRVVFHCIAPPPSLFLLPGGNLVAVACWRHASHSI